MIELSSQRTATESGCNPYAAALQLTIMDLAEQEYIFSKAADAAQTEEERLRMRQSVYAFRRALQFARRRKILAQTYQDEYGRPVA